MKAKTVKTLSLVLVLCLAVSLAACGSNSADTGDDSGKAQEQGTTGGTQDKKATEAEKSEPVEIIYWGDWTGEGEKQFQTMLDEFNKSQDKIVAKYVVTQDIITKFLTASASGQSPDIMLWDRWRTCLYAPKGVLEPIDEFMQRDNVNRDDFYQEALRELSYDGKTYGLPLTVDCRALFYNKKLFEEKGLNPPTTWDQLREAAIALTEWDGDKLVRAGFSLSDVGLFSMWIRQAGGDMLTEDGKKTAFNSPEGLMVLNFWDRLLNEDKVYKVGFESGLGNDVDAFATGKVAMTYTGPWMLSTYKEYGKDLEFGIVPPPAGPNGDRGGMIGGFGLVIPSASKHKEEAWELMKWWLAEPENATMFGKVSLNIPGSKVAAQDEFFSAEDSLYKPFVETFEFAKIRPPVEQYSNMETKALIPQLQLFVEGKLTAEEALKKAQEMGDKILAEQSAE